MLHALAIRVITLTLCADQDQLEHILSNAEIKTVLCSGEQYEKFALASKHLPLQHIIVFDAGTTLVAIRAMRACANA